MRIVKNHAFTDRSEQLVHEIITNAMSLNNWHNPDVYDLEFKTTGTGGAVFGTFNSDLHNTYRGRQMYFEFNHKTIVLKINYKDIMQRKARTAHNQVRFVELLINNNYLKIEN